MHGDKNTTFFHNFVKARRKRNTILKIKNDEGNWVEGNEEMGGLIHSYFSSLFSSEVEHTSEELLSKVIPRVMAEMNSALLKPYTAEEVKQAMFSIGDYKAPRINGLHAVFYKKFWAVVGDDVTREVLQVLNSGVIPRRGASGAIIRDAGGNFMAAACDYTDRASDAESMDASALLAGLKLAEQFNAQSLVVESDCMEVVMVVLNPNEYRGTAYWSSSLTRSMNSGVGHGSWYADGGGGRAGCGNCGQAVACAGGCGESGQGSQAGAAAGARSLKRVGVAGGVVGLPCASADSRSWIASPPTKRAR
ncbi:hypothetical protein QYE76_024390 [Lolium multiflorum]|uniref:RNase H type-1 domain-containing protein n=1 Tax=Lolium multiflorum TaxID=4521 RepID=A0AAD8VW11_LOLMU|nr:hypothetical protein QYE76_024390 [Lolium multiflorum]